jgi:hypothetical protein
MPEPEAVAPGWWIGREEGHPWMGPFVSRDLALQVRSYVEEATKPKTYWVWEAEHIDGSIAPGEEC